MVSGNTLTYPGVRQNVDLAYTMATDGIKGSLVLARPVRYPRWRFGVSSASLAVQVGSDGRIRFARQDTGEVVWRLAPLVMVDASGARSTAVTATWNPTDQTITIEADSAWLGDAARVYPVRVDPSIELEPGMLGLQPYWSYWTYGLDELGEFQVNLATGNLVYTYTDLAFTGQGLTTVLSRVYNSQAEWNGSLGYNWTSNAQMFLLENPDGSIEYQDESGYRVVFRPDGQGGYVSPPGVYKDLAVLGDPAGEYFRLTSFRARTTEYFDRSGKLLRRVDKNGNETRYTYTSGVLAQVVDASGQAFSAAAVGIVGATLATAALLVPASTTAAAAVATAAVAVRIFSTAVNVARAVAGDISWGRAATNIAISWTGTAIAATGARSLGRAVGYVASRWGLANGLSTLLTGR